ncbi:Prokaryotic metallothionein, partial [Micromonospora sp. D75]|nr:Prokaryotic metallothionein [Micromonospora sp. D75]
KIVGHGVEVSGRFFCCAHCARAVEGEQGAEVRDAVGARPA